MILLTGATGFVGSNILKYLVSENYKIVCICRTSSDISRFESLSEYIYWENVDEMNIEQIFYKYNISVVIHCATNYGRNSTEIFNVFETNLKMPIELLKWASKNNTKLFINTDSFFVKAIKNNTIPKKIYMQNYTESKYALYHFVENNISNMNIAFVNMRLEHVYGAENRKGKFAEYIISSLLDNVTQIDLSEGQQLRDWIYIQDVVNAYKIILDNRDFFTPGILYNYEVGTGEMHSVREFVEYVKQITGSTSSLRFGAKSINEGELNESVADNGKLIDLGWKIHWPFKKGIEKMVKEYCTYEKNCFNSDSNI